MDFTVGCEIECFIDSKIVYDHYSLEKLMFKNGFDVYGFGKYNDGRYKKWATVIEFMSGDPQDIESFPREIISPTMSMDKYLTEVPRLVNLLKTCMHTTRGTGFHHGISINDPIANKRMATRNLYLIWRWAMTYEEEELARWNRIKNQYSGSYKPLILGGIFSRHAHTATTWNKIDRYSTLGHLDKRSIVESICLWSTRYSKSMNVNSCRILSDNPYIELRTMGGKDYHLRLPEARITLERFQDLMYETATIDITKNDEFMKFLKDSIKSVALDDVIKYMME